MSFAIKLGGSLLFDENGNLNDQKIKNFVGTIKKHKNIRAIIVGGGKIARKYINSGRNLELNESILDLLGIDVSRINSRLMIAALGESCYPSVIKNIEEAIKISSLTSKIIIAGGFVPGQSTTTVALEIAEAINCENLLIMTDVDGIYDKNPKEFSDARKFDQISVEQIENILFDKKTNQAAAGEYRIFDALSIQIFKRSKINLLLFNGNELEQLEKILSHNVNEQKIGTKIVK